MTIIVSWCGNYREIDKITNLNQISNKNQKSITNTKTHVSITKKNNKPGEEVSRRGANNAKIQKSKEPMICAERRKFSKLND